ncbi:MAG: hypothetical protein CVT88_02650 [Candidatus Altiarchaeales archaeon HGW-Altiarchaeales-1]|nr:MAG: hypothetical protein CVT88_02650 [Candidatus Altiarchaeales archaeon HGW-Altiarchaeales-1]
MTMDLRCPICKSNKINYYGQAFAKYASSEAQYVCKDCGYVGALILDVSADEDKNKNSIESDLKEMSMTTDINEIDAESDIKEKEEESHIREMPTESDLALAWKFMDEKTSLIESDLKETDKESSDLNDEPITPQESIPAEIKNILAGEHYDFIVHAKRTVFIGDSILFLIICLVMLFILGIGTAEPHKNPMSFVVGLFLLLFLLYFIVTAISDIFFNDAWIIGTSKKLSKYQKNKIESFNWEELTDVIKVNGTQEDGSIEILTNIIISNDEGPDYQKTIYIGGIKNVSQIAKLIRKRINENDLTIRNSIQWISLKD